MRILGDLSRGQLRISFFRHEGRVLLKFEDGLLEQTYRFREVEGLTQAQDLEALIDEDFLAEVEQVFVQMRSAGMGAMERHFGRLDQESEGENIWPEII